MDINIQGPCIFLDSFEAAVARYEYARKEFVEAVLDSMIGDAIQKIVQKLSENLEAMGQSINKFYTGGVVGERHYFIGQDQGECAVVHPPVLRRTQDDDVVDRVICELDRRSGRP